MLWTWILKPKNAVIAILVVAVVAFAGISRWNRVLYLSADKKVKQQEVTITGQAAQIEEYKKNIQLAKEHQERVVVIERQGATIRETIREIKAVRDLSDEEKVIAANITNRINGVRHPDDSGAKTGGKVLPDSGKDTNAGTKDNT